MGASSGGRREYGWFLAAGAATAVAHNGLGPDLAGRPPEADSELNTAQLLFRYCSDLGCKKRVRCKPVELPQKAGGGGFKIENEKYDLRQPVCDFFTLAIRRRFHEQADLEGMYNRCAKVALAENKKIKLTP